MHDPDAPQRGDQLVVDLYEVVWSRGELDAVDRLIAPRYTIHHDPGDDWEGQTLTRATYRRRVLYSRGAFPDLRFTLHAVISDGDRVAARWSATGTQRGPLTGVPATDRALTFCGQTMYAITDGMVTGHWQTIDRLGVMRQLGLLPPSP